jgi:hypothetical protein
VFATTFLGHQGWMVRGQRACLLIDPLLREDFGELHALGYRVYPPRVVTPAAFPGLDAVLLSHEHDDHFDIPSLAMLDRAIPIYLSARSSCAARELLASMGFTVHPWSPGIPVRVGDLEILAFTGDHVSTHGGDEWDTLPYLIRSTEGHGSLFSMVDIPLTQQHVEWAAAIAARPGLVTWTNNALDWSHMASYLRERTEGTQQVFSAIGIGHKLITSVWGTPAAMLTCAGGFAFHGDKAWLNQRVFCVDTAEVCALMTRVYKQEKFVAATPGQTFVMRAGKLQAIEPTTAFLATAPRDAWPSRARAEIASPPPDYLPATGQAELAAEAMARLEARLGELAGSLVGGTLFKSLHSLLDSELGGRRPTFVVAARTGGGRRVLAYVATRCAFQVVADDAPEASYLAGLECWAGDLLAVLDGELGPIGLSFARARLWNALPRRFNFDIFGELYRISHPLRRPAEYARSYDRLWRAVATTAPSIYAAAR